MCTEVDVYMYVCTEVDVYVCTEVDVYVCTVCVYVKGMCLGVYKCMHSVYVCMCLYMYVCTCTVHCNF